MQLEEYVKDLDRAAAESYTPDMYAALASVYTNFISNIADGVHTSLEEIQAIAKALITHEEA